jgi:site-specific recombinase XerD
LGRSHAVSEIVRRRLGGAGIVMSHRGAHVFRHGFAARMVAQGHSLKAVADVLGHRHLGTTFGYAKVDFPALEAVPLPWPEEER